MSCITTMKSVIEALTSYSLSIIRLISIKVNDIFV